MTASMFRHRVPLPSHRALRLTAIAVLVFGPIAAAAVAIHGPDRARLGYVEVERTEGDPAAQRARTYLAERDPVLEKLLPNGAGGTRFFRELDGNAGMAFVTVPAVGLAVTAVGGEWPEATELHERAHLLYTFLPQEVSRLMARLGAPASGEYAATNSSEHFAEMARAAWEIVATPSSMCIEATRAERLEETERSVPGTAGFVTWYLRHMPEHESANDEALFRTAALLTAPARGEWDAVWSAVEIRRLPGGGFRSWERPSVREYLQRARADRLRSTSRMERMAGRLLAPSLMVLSIAGR